MSVKSEKRLAEFLRDRENHEQAAIHRISLSKYLHIMQCPDPEIRDQLFKNARRRHAQPKDIAYFPEYTNLRVTKDNIDMLIYLLNQRIEKMDLRERQTTGKPTILFRDRLTRQLRKFDPERLLERAKERTERALVNSRYALAKENQ